MFAHIYQDTRGEQTMTIKEHVVLTYADGKITLKGEKIEAVLEIESSELSKLYFSGTGEGLVELNVDDSSL